jgi:heme/copper-type cytochrome/quinol oxidase subunit 3
VRTNQNKEKRKAKTKKKKVLHIFIQTNFTLFLIFLYVYFRSVVDASEAGTMIQLGEALEGPMIPCTTNHIIKPAMLDQHSKGRLASGPHGQDKQSVP